MAKIIGKNTTISTFKNRIINGNFNIWQRGNSTTTTGNTYLADRWVHSVSTGGTFSRTVTAPTESSYAWNFTASASNTFMQLGQQIEYFSCRDLQNKTVTISFWAKANNSNSGSTSLTVRTRTGLVVDTPIYFTGTASDSPITLTTTYKRYYITKTLPANFGALTLEFVLGSHVSGDGFSISQIQLEEGSAVSKFEVVEFSQDLESCLRFYQRHDSSQPTYYGGPVAGTYWFSLRYSVVMFKQPLIAISTAGYSTNVDDSQTTQTNNAVDGFSIRIVATGNNWATGVIWYSNAEF